MYDKITPFTYYKKHSLFNWDNTDDATLNRYICLAKLSIPTKTMNITYE